MRLKKKSVLQIPKLTGKSEKGEPEHITMEQYNRELREEETEFQDGDYISHDQMLKLIRTW